MGEAGLMRKRSHVRDVCHLSAAVMLLLCAIPGAQAWSNGGYSSNPANPDYGTHDWIAEEALTIQVWNVTFLSSTFHSEYLLGTEAPDNPAYIGDSGNHHVYYYSGGALQDDVCADRALAIYGSALAYLEANEYVYAAFEIGVMAHYISDVGVFGHTMGSATDWGSEVHHSDYESGFESRLGSLSLPSTALGNSDAYSATTGLASTITFGSGTIKSNIWMDTNYDWADSVFVASAMASLYRSVSAVAAAINHLMIEAAIPPPPEPPPPTPLPEVPHPPASLTASVNGSHAILTWTAPSSDGGAAITGYKIYRGISLSNPLYLTSVVSSARTWNDESIEKGKTYYYWVKADNSVGSSGLSQVASVVVPGDSNSLLLPLAVSSISVALASGGTLLWLRKRRRKSRR